MRIACLYLPSLPLQVFLRGAPQWIGAPVALTTGGRVLACSRAAWTAGVRPGMAGPAAHDLVRDLVAVPFEGEHVAAQRAALAALGDALLGVTARVDLGGAPAGVHHAVYCEVPHRTRGNSFGARLVEIARAQGLRVRIGIADDRFTAWVAASYGHVDDGADHVHTVPRGGSAAFLAPLPLSLLPIGPEVQQVLAAVGVRTLGEFAALPPPSVSHPRSVTMFGAGADYQALARGDGGSALTLHEPCGPIVERVAVGGALGVGAALGLASARVAARLAGRGTAATAIAVRTGSRSLEVPVAPTADAAELSDALGAALHEGGAAAFVELEVIRTDTAAAPAPAPAPAAPAVTASDLATCVPAAVLAEGSAPTATAGEPPVFRLTPPVLGEVRMAPRAPHRRTRRGKQRTRATVAAQSRLFGRR